MIMCETEKQTAIREKALARTLNLCVQGNAFAIMALVGIIIASFIFTCLIRPDLLIREFRNAKDEEDDDIYYQAGHH